MRFRSLWLVLLLTAHLSCSSTNPDVRARRLPDGRIQVDGPLVGPSKTLEELAEQACDLMTRQPGASNGPYGFEYCAMYYYSKKEDAYFLSYLSEIKGKLDSMEKTCSLPNSLHDPAHEDAILLGGAHSHSNNRKFSPRDLSAAAHWRPVRFFDKGTGRLWDRQLMVFYREKTGECRAYKYNNSTRVVSALRNGTWDPIGEVYDDMGYFRLYEGKDWLP